MKLKGYLLISLGTIFIIIAASLLYYNLNLEKEAKTVADRIVPEIIKEIKTNQGKSDAVIQPASQTESVQHKTNEKYLELNSKKYMGILTFPSLGLELPILASYVYKDLMTAPCCYSGNPAGYMVIAAHNFKAHFGNIYKLSKGDTILFTDIEGNVTQYKVMLQKEVNVEDIDKFFDMHYDLTLITCNYLGNKRVMVGCEKVED